MLLRLSGGLLQMMRGASTGRGVALGRQLPFQQVTRAHVRQLTAFASAQQHAKQAHSPLSRFACSAKTATLQAHNAEARMHVPAHHLAGTNTCCHQCRRCRCLSSAAPCLLQPARRLASAAAATQQASDALTGAAAQQLGIDDKLLRKATPRYCSGCGVKLQQADADAPG